MKTIAIFLADEVMIVPINGPPLNLLVPRSPDGGAGGPHKARTDFWRNPTSYRCGTAGIEGEEKTVDAVWSGKAGEAAFVAADRQGRPPS